MATPVGQRPAKVPSVLRCAYSRVVSLEAAIRDLCVSSSLEPPELRRADDPPEYADTLLRRTFVAFPSRAPPLPPDVTFQLLGDPDDVISRALSLLFRWQNQPNNVLCNGARRRGPNTNRRSSAGGCQLRDHATDPAAPRPPDVDVVHKSAAIDALRRPAWRTFASRVGDAVFLHLLTRASVFTPLGERGSSGDAPSAAGSHLQLCGAPVASAARGRAGAAARARAATTQDARARDLNPRGGKMATKAARGGRGGGDDGAVRGGRRGRGRGGGGDGSPGGRDGFGRSAAASSEEPRGRVASAPAFVEDANVSPVGKLLRRASVFVRGVMTANPFMRRALAPTQTRGAYYAARSRRDRTANRTMGTSSEDSVALVAESSDAHVSGSGGPAPQEATMASPPRSKTSRPSSWRRRKDAKAREATAKASEREVTDSPNDSNDVRATHDAASAAMWDEIGHAAAARPDEEDARETAVEETPPRPPSSSPNQTPRARAPTTPGARTPATRSTPGSPSSRRASDARRATGKEPRPGSVVFDASAFMHKSSYPRLPGLPRRHALNASGTGPAAARRLYRLIFVPPKARAKDKNESARASVAAAGVGGGGAGGFAFPGTSGSVHAVGPRGAYAAWTTPAKQHNARRVRRIARRDREALLPLLSAMLRRASKCPYGALLDLHCPTPSWLSRRGEPATPDEKAPADAPRSLLASFTPPKAVAAFLWSTTSRIVPREMLGGPRSRAAIRAFLLRLVVLRRFEQCTLHEAMVGVREREFPWLRGKRGEWIDDDAGRRAGRGGPVAASEARRAKLRRWIRWLVAELAVPLLRSHFYCTETESHRLRVFYYRKGVWARLTAAHLAAMTEDPAGETRASLAVGGDRPGEDDPAAATAATAAYRRMPRRRARLLLQRHLLGFARLRLLPKATGLRPVAMLGRPAVASFRTLRGSSGGNAPGGGDGRWKARIGGRGQRDVLAFRPVNTSLQGVFDVLRHEAGAKPGVMGANVSDYRDAHRRLGPFIRRWRATQRRERRARRDDRGGAGVGEEEADSRSRGGRCTAVAAPAPSPPFIVAADVKGAFDSIPLRALERVVTELVTAGEYEVASVAHTRGGLSGGVRTKTRRVAARVAATNEPELDPRPEREPDVGESSARGARRVRERRVGGVVVDLASPFRVHRSQILELLHEHLRRNVVRSGGVYLLQTVGIPQGSVLSTLLCAVFYANLESTHGLTRDERGADERAKDAVLCRWTDDLLHVSAEREPAEAFLSAALAGFAEYGCAVNPSKTSLNFDFAPAATDSGAVPPAIPRRETSAGRGANARACVAWCGLLIDSRTLEIRVDYGRYAGDWAREAVTVPGHAGSGRSNPFDRLDRRVVAYLRPKCTALLYDHSINSPLVARLNVYQSFLLAAVKTHCFVAAANPRGKRGGGGGKGDGGGDSGGNKRRDSRKPSPAVLHEAIVAGVRYMEGAVRHHMAVARATLGASGRIQRTHIRYLGLHAFAKILRRKQARYRGTLALIAEDLRAPTMRAAARRLAPVVEESLSAVFDEIRF